MIYWSVKLSRDSDIVRSLIFGIQDSFGSTVGFLSGIAVSNMSRNDMLFTGALLIFVEAFSMAAGVLISNHTVDEVKSRRALPLLVKLKSPIVMFFAYALSGFVPLSPYYFFWGQYSLVASIGVSLLVLACIGYISAKLYKISPFHHIKETLLVSIVAIGAGVLIGKLA